MNKPDWDRVLVDARSGGAQVRADKPPPLGDSTRWGANVPQTILFGSTAPNRGAINQSGQIIQVQCKDAYPRAWTIVGTLSAPANVWGLPNGAALGEWAAVMSVSMGIGQAQVLHNFDLRATVESDRPWYWNSNIGDEVFGTVGNIVRPFIMPGALVGGSVSISIIQSLFTNDVGTFTANFLTSLIVTPFDPGIE
jgi:hypothetical protein